MGGRRTDKLIESIKEAVVLVKEGKNGNKFLDAHSNTISKNK